MIHYFLYVLSHEIRTPLNSIIGNLQMLSQSQATNSQRNCITSMNQSCFQLLRIINDILDFSNLTLGKTSINSECFVFSDLIEEVKSAVSTRIAEKQQKLIFEFYGVPPKIVCDKIKLLQILVNLITNANKFTNSNGRILVTITSNENTLQFSVEDNGIGIDKSNQELIFEEFKQIDGIRYGGSGLGLTIVKKLVELLGGKIEVESELGKGSVFTFTVNFETAEMYRDRIQHSASILRDKHVLVLEEDSELRGKILEMLFEFELNALVCSSNTELLTILTKRRYPFDIILLDNNAQETRVRELAKNTPILFTCQTEIFNDNTILKPINKFELIKKLTTIVETTEKRVNCNVKILVVDDDTSNLELMKSMLATLGYRDVVGVNSGREAIEKLGSETFSILFVDLMMPDVSGMDVMKFVKMKNLSTKTVVLTASAWQNREECKKYGALYFLLKPINMNTIKTILTHLV